MKTPGFYFLTRPKRYAAGLIVLALPFYLNDFSSIYVKDWRWWLLIDYILVKAVPLAGAAWMIRTERISFEDLGLKGQKVFAFIAWATGLTLICTLMDQNAYALMEGLPGYTALGGMPAITIPFWDTLDLTVGLFFVALCEELVFRGFLFQFFRQFTASTWAVILLSSAAFGLAHWCQGLHAMIITGLIGAVLMGGYIRMRSIYPLILAHFLVNYIDFSGVIPKAIFKFF